MHFFVDKLLLIFMLHILFFLLWYLVNYLGWRCKSIFYEIYSTSIRTFLSHKIREFCFIHSKSFPFLKRIFFIIYYVEYNNQYESELNTKQVQYFKSQVNNGLRSKYKIIENIFLLHYTPQSKFMHTDLYSELIF